VSGLVSNPVRLIRTVHLKTPNARLAESPTELRFGRKVCKYPGTESLARETIEVLRNKLMVKFKACRDKGFTGPTGLVRGVGLPLDSADAMLICCATDLVCNNYMVNKEQVPRNNRRLFFANVPGPDKRRPNAEDWAMMILVENKLVENKLERDGDVFIHFCFDSAVQALDIATTQVDKHAFWKSRAGQEVFVTRAVLDSAENVSALVSSLTRHIVRQYATSGRANISFKEIYDEIVGAYKRAPRRSDVNIAIQCAVRAGKLSMTGDYVYSTV